MSPQKQELSVMSLVSSQQREFTVISSEKLTDYITALAWLPQGKVLVATSAAGEVMLWENGELISLQNSTGKSLDCAAFSADGKYLAVGGQDGQVKIWRGKELVTTLNKSPIWVERLAWNQTSNQLALSLGRCIQIWDVDKAESIVTLDFDSSSALCIDWRSDGKYLAVSGYKGVKIWHTQDWEEEPFIFSMPTVSVTMAWSGDGKYLASGNMDRTIAILDWEGTEPWVIGGFPGKIRQLAWSNRPSQQEAPFFASSSVEGIVIWEKSLDPAIGWSARVLNNHVDIVRAIAFAPNSSLLASAGADGWLCLWNEAQEVSQILTGVSAGFSTLAWDNDGELIAAGGDKGELIIWS